MIYSAKVCRLKYFDDYQGPVELKVGRMWLHGWHTFPFSFAESYFVAGETVDVDLWIGFGHAEIVEPGEEFFDPDTNSARGRVFQRLRPRQFRVSCGDFLIDVFDEGDCDPKVGDYIQVKGSLEVFAPNTEYSKEESWD